MKTIKPRLHTIEHLLVPCPECNYVIDLFDHFEYDMEIIEKLNSFRGTYDCENYFNDVNMEIKCCYCGETLKLAEDFY